MPILCDPNSTFPVWLKSDENKTPRPTFSVRCQSMRGQMAICATLDKLTDDATGTAELFAETLERLGEVIVGWKDMPLPFSKENIGELLNYAEARELLRTVLYNSQVGPDEKKD